ncbi:MAG TPA: LemA family protein [Actinomycetota bacterium]|nr:LemA family protein [Actinomycetota bacterium]
MSTGIILAIVGGVLVLYAILLYNRMRTTSNKVDNAWSGVDVELRRRYDLIPNLVETVKGYAAHEKETFEAVTRARAMGIEAKSVPEQAEAEGFLTQALRQVFAVAEAYPQLRANENFNQLQAELAQTEGRIAFARQYYNDIVMRFNNLIQVFPNLLLARMFGFQRRDFFEVDEDSRGPVKVEF